MEIYTYKTFLLNQQNTKGTREGPLSTQVAGSWEEEPSTEGASEQLQSTSHSLEVISTHVQERGPEFITCTQEQIANL